jgi:hypothetical protein
MVISGAELGVRVCRPRLDFESVLLLVVGVTTPSARPAADRAAALAMGLVRCVHLSDQPVHVLSGSSH